MVHARQPEIDMPLARIRYGGVERWKISGALLHRDSHDVAEDAVHVLHMAQWLFPSATRVL